MFEQRVLEVTEDIMFKWRLLVKDGRKTGHTFSQPDLILAATALEHGLTLLSRDTSDYEKAHVPMIIRGTPSNDLAAAVRGVFKVKESATSSEFWVLQPLPEVCMKSQ